MTYIAAVTPITEALDRLQTVLSNPTFGKKASRKSIRDLGYLRKTFNDLFLRPAYVREYFEGGESPYGLSNTDLAMAELIRRPMSATTEEYTPIFILGHRRSGTTLLAWLLDSHPSIAAIPENNLCSSLLPPNGASPVGLPLRSLELLDEPRSSFLARYAGLINGVFHDYAVRKGKRRWVDKEPLLQDRVDFLDTIFDYRARYIYIVRHGLDVAFSASVIDRINSFQYMSPICGLGIERHLQSWVKMNESLASFHLCNQTRSMLVRYEEFVKAPEIVAKRLFTHLQEPWVPTILDDMQHQEHSTGLGDLHILKTGGKIQRDRCGRWVTWPKPVLERLGRIVNPTLVRLGYDRI